MSDPHTPTIIIGDNAASLPVLLPPGEQRSEALRGDVVRAHLETIVEFSRESRRNGDKLWGRIAGQPAYRKTAEWAAQEFRKAGIAQVSVEELPVTSPLWLPVGWTVRVQGGGPDVVLQSAFPQRGSPSISGTLTAPAVFVGAGTAAEVAGRDLGGQDRRRAQEAGPRPLLLEGRPCRRASAQAGSHHGGHRASWKHAGVRLLRGAGIPCFYLGGQDGQFLEAAISAAQRTGARPLQMSVQLETTALTGMTAANAVAVIPGKNPGGENIILNAHADGFFEGASDNGDGLAVLVALAHHFAQPRHRPERTLVLVAAAGHHTPGGNGAAAFVARHPEIVGKTVFILNLEHIAQVNMQSTVRPLAGRAGYRDLVADAVEYPQSVGITRESPFLFELFGRAARLYGKNVYTRFDCRGAGRSRRLRAGHRPEGAADSCDPDVPHDR